MHDYGSSEIVKILFRVAERKPEKCSWEMSLTDEMYKLWLGYIWSDRLGRDLIGSWVRLHIASNKT